MHSFAHSFRGRVMNSEKIALCKRVDKNGLDLAYAKPGKTAHGLSAAQSYLVNTAACAIDGVTARLNF